MAVSWIYRLQRDDLVEELHKHNLDICGSVAVLRQRLVEFVKANAELFADRPLDPEDYNEDPDRTRDEEEDKKQVLALPQLSLVAQQSSNEQHPTGQQQVSDRSSGSGPSRTTPDDGTEEAKTPPSTDRSDPGTNQTSPLQGGGMRTSTPSDRRPHALSPCPPHVPISRGRMCIPSWNESRNCKSPTVSKKGSCSRAFRSYSVETRSIGTAT